MVTLNMVQLVVKSQVLAGGRGLGKFKNGFEGGVHIVKADKVEETAGNEEWCLSFNKNLIGGFSFVYFSINCWIIYYLSYC